MYLGEIIKKYRNEHGLSMQAFADKCKLSKGYIAMLERNVNSKTGEPIVPSLETFSKVSNAMGLTISEIMEKVDENQPIALEYVMDYTERENVKGVARNILSNDSNLSLEQKVFHQEEIFRSLFARSFEMNHYNLYHSTFDSYVSMLLYQEHYKSNLDSALYNELVDIYGIIDGSFYGLDSGKTVFIVPDVQGDYTTILDEQINLNGDILKELNKLDEEGKKKVLDYTKDLSFRYAKKFEHEFEKILLSDYKETLPAAAHERTDIEVTEDMRKHDDDIMDDDNF